MSSATPAIRDLARRLIALEAARGEADAHEAGMVCDRLRGPLARLAGTAGFRSLLSRALALAKVEAPSLQSVQIGEDGSLGRFNGAGVATTGDAVVAHLLGLLVTFIGEPLTRQLVNDTWPDLAADETNGSDGGQS